METSGAQLFSAAAERNREAILKVLERVLPRNATVLEVGAGTGQHAAFFVPRLPGVTWLPTDVSDRAIASVEAWARTVNSERLLRPRLLNVLDHDWDGLEWDTVFSANMIHISPWEVCEALFRGASRYVQPEGLVILYGPFRLGGEHTAPSNEAFDADLRRRDPRWGVRDLEEVMAVAERNGFRFVERVAMPANNQTVVFRRATQQEDRRNG